MFRVGLYPSQMDCRSHVRGTLWRNGSEQPAEVNDWDSFLERRRGDIEDYHCSNFPAIWKEISLMQNNLFHLGEEDESKGHTKTDGC